MSQNKKGTEWNRLGFKYINDNDEISCSLGTLPNGKENWIIIACA